jgi:hypothetical protein
MRKETENEKDYPPAAGLADDDSKLPTRADAGSTDARSADTDRDSTNSGSTDARTANTERDSTNGDANPCPNQHP